MRRVTKRRARYNRGALAGSRRLASADIPQANDLGGIRAVVAAIERGFQDVSRISRLTRISTRHVSYDLRSAQILDLVREGPDGSLVLTSLGSSLLSTDPNSVDEREILRRAIA